MWCTTSEERSVLVRYYAIFPRVLEPEGSLPMRATVAAGLPGPPSLVGRGSRVDIDRSGRRTRASASIRRLRCTGRGNNRCRLGPRAGTGDDPTASTRDDGSVDPAAAVGAISESTSDEDAARERKEHHRTWSLKYLEGVMVGVSRYATDSYASVTRLGGEVYRWASRDEGGARGDVAAKSGKRKRRGDTPAKSSSSSSLSSGDEEDWEAALASWVSDDDADPLTDAAEWVGGIASWVATYSERSKAKSAARAEPPPLTVTALTNEMRLEMELGADEAHFLPLEDSGWSIALLRYRPKEGGARRSKQSRAIPAVSVTSMDAAWDDSDFYYATPWRHRDHPPVMMVPGCASNAYTFDVAEGYSLARHLANRGHDTWIVESRGVGFSRPWGAKPSEWADPKTKVPRQHMPTWGDFDFDTYLREDLPCAAGYIAAVTGSKRIAAVGHSMGGMLVACMAAGAADYFREESPKVEQSAGAATSEPRVPRSDWRIDKVVTVASCLECSPREGVPESTYAQFAALAGVVPEYLYGGVAKLGPAVPQLPVGSLSVGQGIAIESVFGAPSVDDGDGEDDYENAVVDDDDDYEDNGASDDEKGASDEFWRKSAVSLNTSYPGATKPALIRKLLLKGFGNVPLRLVLQMATLFSPGGLATREETVARRERTVSAARERRAGWRRRLRGWGDPGDAPREATVADVVESEMSGDSAAAVRASARGVHRGDHHVHYIDAVRDARPKILMIAGDVDPVIPPSQVEATAAVVGGEYACFGDGPKSGWDVRDSNDPNAALRSMMTDGGDHYSHYDLLCGVNAPRRVFPVVSEFLERIEVLNGLFRL